MASFKSKFGVGCNKVELSIHVSLLILVSIYEPPRLHHKKINDNHS